MKLTRENILFILIGPTGSGKTTFAKRLLKDYSELLKFSVSATTRSPREDEVAGESYIFMSKEEFQEKVANNEFFEWEEVHGQCYGTLKSTIQESLQSGGDLLLDIEIKGALNIRKAYPNNAVIIFLVPPSIKIMKERLAFRGEMSDSELQRRLATAKFELTKLNSPEEGKYIDYYLINDDLAVTYANIRDIYVAEKYKLARISKEDLMKPEQIEES